MDEFSGFKVMKHWDKFKKVVEGEFIYPITVEFSITNKCNGNCIWCNDRILREKYPFELPTGTVLRTLKDMRTSGVEAVCFEGGGEPTIHPDFKKIITYAKETGFQVGLITNGSKCFEYAEDIMKSVDWVRISLDAGTKETHKKLHRVKHWDDIIDGIKKMTNFRNTAELKSKIGISYIITDENWLESAMCAELVKNLGCDYIQFKPLINLDGTFYFGAFADAKMGKKTYEDENFKVHIPKRYQKTKRNYEKCYAFYFSTQIGASGNVHLCCNTRLRKHLYLGNIKDKPFSKIWDRKKLNEIQSKVNLNKCPVCRHDELNNLINFIKTGEANAFV